MRGRSNFSFRVLSPHTLSQCLSCPSLYPLAVLLSDTYPLKCRYFLETLAIPCYRLCAYLLHKKFLNAGTHSLLAFQPLPRSLYRFQAICAFCSPYPLLLCPLFLDLKRLLRQWVCKNGIETLDTTVFETFKL